MKITGKSKTVSREFVRAWVNASAAVLSYHNHHMDLDTLTVRITDLRKRVNRITGGGDSGVAYPSRNLIELSKFMSRECMATVVVHECIHIAVGDMGDDTDELCCSRLTAKLKPWVAKIAAVLQDGANNRAANFAHIKIAYRNEPGKPDRYDANQWVKVGAVDKHRDRKAQRVPDDLSLFDDLFALPGASREGEA